METGEQTVLLVSSNASLSSLVHREISNREKKLRVATVNSVEAACRFVEDSVPAVILLEDPSLELVGVPAKSRLDTLVAPLALRAPIVVIDDVQRQSEMAALVAAGLADFVVRSENCLVLALDCVDRRLELSRQKKAKGVGSRRTKKMAERNISLGSLNKEDFGEVLRHELNNPLTGILGNAELLLTEVRRKSDGTLPQGAQQRLETIASLAVRLRETVRRLSLEWEARQNPVH